MAYSAVIPHRWHQMFIANRESLLGLNYLTLIALAGKLIKYVLELSLVQIDCVLRDGFFSFCILMRNDNLFLRSWYLFGFDLPKTQSMYTLCKQNYVPMAGKNPWLIISHSTCTLLCRHSSKAVHLLFSTGRRKKNSTWIKIDNEIVWEKSEPFYAFDAHQISSPKNK